MSACGVCKIACVTVGVIVGKRVSDKFIDKSGMGKGGEGNYVEHCALNFKTKWRAGILLLCFCFASSLTYDSAQFFQNLNINFFFSIFEWLWLF